MNLKPEAQIILRSRYTSVNYPTTRLSVPAQNRTTGIPKFSTSRNLDGSAENPETSYQQRLTSPSLRQTRRHRPTCPSGHQPAKKTAESACCDRCRPLKHRWSPVCGPPPVDQYEDGSDGGCSSAAGASGAADASGAAASAGGAVTWSLSPFRGRTLTIV